jgi:hypothetical protein
VSRFRRRLHTDYTQEPWAVQAWAKAHAKARAPQRRAKIAAARRGKPRPPHIGRAVVAAHCGKRLSEETRRRMSEAHRPRGTLVPGTTVWGRLRNVCSGKSRLRRLHELSQRAPDARLQPFPVVTLVVPPASAP